MAQRVHTHPGGLPGGPGEAVGFGTAPAPVADVHLVAAQGHIKGSKPHVPDTGGFAGARIQFEQAIGEIQRHVEALAIGRKSQPGGDVVAPFANLHLRQQETVQRLDPAFAAHAEYLDAALHVRQIKPRAIRRKYQPGKTQLAARIRLQLMGRDRFRPRFRVLRRQRHLLENPARGRVDHHQGGRLAGGDQDAAIGAQRQGLRAHPRQFDQSARRGQSLVDRGIIPTGGGLFDRPGGRSPRRERGVRGAPAQPHGPTER